MLISWNLLCFDGEAYFAPDVVPAHVTKIFIVIVMGCQL